MVQVEPIKVRGLTSKASSPRSRASLCLVISRLRASPQKGVEAMALARIIHIFEDNKSLLCYKHVDKTMFAATKEASECLTIAQHSVCCSREFFASLSWPSSISGARLPIHLAHPLKDEHAVVIHALGPSLQGSRQNRGEPCRPFPADTPSRGSVVVKTRRLYTINTW